MGKSLKLSKSLLQLYLFCPRKWYYNYRSGLPKKLDYPRLAGIQVHNFVGHWLHKKTKENRPFFYKDKKSAIKGWFFVWKRALNDKSIQKRLISRDPDKEKRFGEIGAICIANYWNANYKLPRPLEIEKRYKHKTPGGIPFIGIYDQLRLCSVGWIKIHRPELIKDGELIAGYDPVI